MGGYDGAHISFLTYFPFTSPSNCFHGPFLCYRACLGASFSLLHPLSGFLERDISSVLRGPVSGRVIRWEGGEEKRHGSWGEWCVRSIYVSICTWRLSRSSVYGIENVKRIDSAAAPSFQDYYR